MDKKTTRLENILNLKQKIVSLQNQLAALEKLEKKQVSISPIKYTPIKQTIKQSHVESFQQKNYKSQFRHIYQQNSSKRKTFKNPTFWGQNPIINDNNSQKNRDSKTNLKKKQFTAQMLHRIMQNTTDKFYRSNESSIQSIKQTPLNQNTKQNLKDKPLNLKKDLYNNRNQSHYNSIDKIQKTKIKTFQYKFTNPILEPPKQRHNTKKIYKNKENSIHTKNICTDHNKSNQLLYFLPSSKPIYLSSKLGQTRHRKNDSASFKNLLSNSLEKSQEKDSLNQSKGKKHFSRYFLDMSKNVFESQTSVG